MVGRRDRRHGDEGDVRHGPPWMRDFFVSNNISLPETSVVAVLVSCIQRIQFSPKSATKSLQRKAASEPKSTPIDPFPSAFVALPSKGPMLTPTQLSNHQGA